MPSALLTQKNSLKVKVILLATVMVKLFALVAFSSDYKDQLFLPFVYQFLEFGGNPWQYAALNAPSLEFPYPPMMLYILSVFMWPIKVLGLNGGVLESVFYGLPLLLSDFLLFYTLIRLFPWRKTEIYIFYFVSPVVMYSIFMHGQLDIIPTALMFFALKLLTEKKLFWVVLLLAAAISTKFHTVAILPIVCIYLFNKKKYREAACMAVFPLAIYTLLISPYMTSDGYQSLVIHSEKQQLIFNTFLEIGKLKVYLPILVALFIYLRFLTFQKINIDLLYSVSGALFSVFLLLVEPAPGWFVWIVPFFSIFYIRYFSGYMHYIFYVLLTTLYLIYYLIFHQYDHVPLYFLGENVGLSISDTQLAYNSIVFTIMEAVLLASIYHFYKSGITSNQVYAMEEAFVLGIGGDSSTGKTTLLDSLSRLFNKDLLRLEGDGEHKWERGDDHWDTYTHLNPKANSLHKQANKISQLKMRQTIKRPDYDHQTGKFTEEETIRPKNFIVIAGLHPFYLPKMRKVIDLKIFLDLDESLRKDWKIRRDVSERGHSHERVIKSIDSRLKDAEKYIHPQKKFSNVIIRYFDLDREESIRDIGGLRANEEIISADVPRLGLTISIDASIPIQGFISDLERNNVGVSWDYSEDLQHQVVTFYEEPKLASFDELTECYITNASELVDQPQWDPGYKGIVQFILLFIVSEVLKEKTGNNV